MQPLYLTEQQRMYNAAVMQDVMECLLACSCHADFSWDEQTYAFWGTVDYASVRNLKGYHPTPRDDLEQLACALLEMALGEGLTWHGHSVASLQLHQTKLHQIQSWYRAAMLLHAVWHSPSNLLRSCAACAVLCR